MSIIGFHFVDNVYDGARRARWLQQIIRIRPRFVVVLVGAQREQATEFVREIRRNSPQTNVIIRHYADGGDDGMWERMEPEDYVYRIGGLYTEQLADIDGWYLMPTNEFASPDRAMYDAWSAWQILAAKTAHETGLRLALGCQPTHNPEPDKVHYLDVLFQVFKKYPEHIYYRNVYYSDDNLDGIRYVRDIVQRMKVTAGYVPTIVIGEFAKLRKITDAQHGYKSIGVATRDAMAREAVHLYRTYWQGLSPFGVYVCYYCVGDWPLGVYTDGPRKGQKKDTFNIADDNAFFDVLAEVANEKLPDTAPLPSEPRPPIVTPEPEPPITLPIPTVPPPDEEDTTEIERPDRVARKRQYLELVQAEVAALHSEREMARRTYEARMNWLDKRAQLLQVKLLLAEMELSDEEKAAGIAA